MTLKKSKILKKFNQDGYIVIRNVISREMIKKVLLDLENIKIRVQKRSNQYSHKTKNGQFNSIHDINKFVKSGQVLNLSKNQKILKIVKHLVGDDVVLRNIEFFLKPKKNKMSTPFHQDNFYWNVVDAKAVNIWIACSEANKKNGGMCYLKSSHTMGTINHEVSFVKGTSQKISEKF